MSGEAWSWRASRGAIEVAFVGRGAESEAPRALAGLERSPHQLAWARQVHGARVLEAAPGACGEGDALITQREDLALCVVTADCVPVLLAGGERIAAVHAGWRGIAGGVVARTLEALAPTSPVGSLEAWIGPAIGACCYEVDDEVAGQITAASHPSVRAPGPAGKPHLDLVAAVAHQLRVRGVERLHTVDLCTRCSARELWSYRREGAGAGRNLAFIWRRSESA